MEYNKKILARRNKMFNVNNSSNINNLFFDEILNNIKEDYYILDIGTGTGYVLNQIYNNINKVHLFGNDNSPVMLDEAKKRCPFANFVLCDNYNLDFDSNSFDMVVAKNVTRFSAREIYRILKPGGIFIYREYGKGKGFREIAQLFKERLIRSRCKSFYVNKLKEAGFDIKKSFYCYSTKNYSIQEIIDIIKSYPFIKDFNLEDEHFLKKHFAEKVHITADPFLIVAVKGGENENRK